MSHFPPAKSLADLVTATGVDGVHDLALRCGAVEIAPKAGQEWRLVMEHQIIIGYKTTVVVAGRDALAMEYVAAQLRATADESTDWLTIMPYHALWLALQLRTVVQGASRGDLAAIVSRYTSAIAQLADLDEQRCNAVLRALEEHAPDAPRAVQLAMAVYARGLCDGLDVSANVRDDDVYGVPDTQESMPPMVKSA